MKKILSVLIVVIMCMGSVAVNAAVVFPDSTNALENCFVDVGDATDYVKYDAATDSIQAVSPNGKNQGGTLTLPAAISDSETVFGFTVKPNSASHARTALDFYDTDGNNFFTIYVQIDSESRFHLRNSANSWFSNVSNTDQSEIDVEIKFDFTNSKCSIRQAAKVNGEFVWADWTDNNAAFSATADDFKSLKVNTRWMYSDLSFYDVTVVAPDEEDDYFDTIYKRVVNEDFASKPENLTVSDKTGNNYAEYDKANANIRVYNEGTGGKSSAVMTFDTAVDTDGSKIAFTFNTGSTHDRMRIHFINSNGEIVHNLYLYYKDNIGSVYFGDKNTKLLCNSNQLRGTLVRGEIKFDFAKKTATYRMGTLVNGEWVFGAETAPKAFESDATPTLYDVKSIEFGNQWTVCDATVDDLKVYVPKLSVSGCTVDVNAKKVSVTVKNNDEASTARVVCAVYDSTGALAEVKLNEANQEITNGTVIDFDFDTVTDFTDCRVFMLDSVQTLTPVSFVYKK